MADLATRTRLTFPPLSEAQRVGLSKVLGPKVTLANPLDYHTYIWRDADAMAAAFSAMIESEIALTVLIVDFPRSDRCDTSDWECVIEAALRTRADTGGRIAMVSTLPELMPEDVALRLMAGGVVPLNGLSEGLAAMEAALVRHPANDDLILPPPPGPARMLSEAEGKAALRAYGLSVPDTCVGDLRAVIAFSAASTGPFVLKSTGAAHKSDTGGVALGLATPEDIRKAALRIGGESFLIEPMIQETVAELLIGVVKDEAHGFVITLGAGGVWTEVLRDTCSLLLPTTGEQVKQSLTQLKIGRILRGYRGKPAADIAAIADAVMAVQAYVLANLDRVEEVEINPLIATPTLAVAVDVLIRKRNV